MSVVGWDWRVCRVPVVLNTSYSIISSALALRSGFNGTQTTGSWHGPIIIRARDTRLIGHMFWTFSCCRRSRKNWSFARSSFIGSSTVSHLPSLHVGSQVSCLAWRTWRIWNTRHFQRPTWCCKHSLASKSDFSIICISYAPILSWIVSCCMSWTISCRALYRRRLRHWAYKTRSWMDYVWSAFYALLYHPRSLDEMKRLYSWRVVLVLHAIVFYACLIRWHIMALASRARRAKEAWNLELQE